MNMNYNPLVSTGITFATIILQTSRSMGCVCLSARADPEVGREENRKENKTRTDNLFHQRQSLQHTGRSQMVEQRTARM